MGTHPIFESDFDCLTEIGYGLLCEALLGLSDANTLKFGGDTSGNECEYGPSH